MQNQINSLMTFDAQLKTALKAFNETLLQQPFSISFVFANVKRSAGCPPLSTLLGMSVRTNRALNDVSISLIHSSIHSCGLELMLKKMLRSLAWALTLFVPVEFLDNFCNFGHTLVANESNFISCSFSLKKVKDKVWNARLRSPLFNTRQYAHDLENLLLKIWRRHESDLECDHVSC